MEPHGRFFERKLQIVLNFHSLELVPQEGSKKKFRLRNLKNAEKGPHCMQ